MNEEVRGNLSFNLQDDWSKSWYDESCQQCPRLAAFLSDVKKEFPHYACKPVPPFGDPKAEILIVGLAPGKHGANATGRPFTGDYAGTLLYETLHKYGLSSMPASLSREDGLQLINCRITNAVKCLPPQNKPVGDEVKQCNPYLLTELAEPNLKILVALGQLAHRAILKAHGLVLSKYPFAHKSVHPITPQLTMVSSYHCSRYNTQTNRLTESMFHEVFDIVQSLINKPL